MQDFLLSADVMVAPFSQVLTSSSVIVGLSYGLPVIVPNLGCLPELVTPEAGIVYKADDSPALPEALRLIKTRDLPAMGKAARRISEDLDWSAIARRTVAVYRSVLA
jgi:glycosyltransferase involved in cell wall biosynthesis